MCTKETAGSARLRLTDFEGGASVLRISGGSGQAAQPWSSKPHPHSSAEMTKVFKVKQTASVPSGSSDSKSLLRILCSSSKQQRQIIPSIITPSASLIKSSAECLHEFVV